VRTAYLAGLRQAGWRGDEAMGLLGMTAYAVKYAWLLPATLARASDPDHHAYFRTVDGEELYAGRGAAFAMLVDWVDEALRLADRLGR